MESDFSGRDRVLSVHKLELLYVNSETDFSSILAISTVF